MGKIATVYPIGGVNLLRDQKTIRDDQAVMTRNMYPVRPGILGKRPARDVQFNVYADNEPIYPVAFHIPAFESLADYFTVHRALTGGVFLKGLSSQGTVISSTTLNSSVRRPFFLSYEGRGEANAQTYVLPGAGDLPGYVISPVPGGDVTDPDGEFVITNGVKTAKFRFDGEGNSGVIPTAATVYRNRFVYVVGNFLVFSDRYQPTVIGNNALAANGRAIGVGNTDGDRIVAVNEVMLGAQGTPDEGALLVLKEHSAYLLTGEPGETTDTDPFGDLAVKRFNVDCGCAAPETFARSVTSGYLWAGPEDVWLYEPGAAQPRPVGTNIRLALKYGPKAMLYRWDGKYDPTDGHYKLAIPGENQSPGDNDPMQDQWWLDLREGAPQNAAAAQWYGPQQFISYTEFGQTPTETGSYCMAVDTKAGHDNALYGLEKCVGNVFNRWGICVASYSARNSRDAQSAFTAGTTPNGTEIQGEIRTKQYDLGDPIVQKIFNAAELSVATGGAAQFQVTANMGNGVQVGLGTATSPGSGFIVGADLTDGDTLLADEPQAVTLYPPSATRYTGRTVQLYIQDTPTNVVYAGYNDKVVFSVATVVYVATIAPGAYASLYDFAQAVVAALNTRAAAAGLAGTFTHNITSATVRPTLVTITNSAVTWTPENGSAATVMSSAADGRSSAIVWARLGFAAYPSAALAQTADQEVYNRECFSTELAAFNIDFDVIPRRTI
jgi:hypothetical protein